MKYIIAINMYNPFVNISFQYFLLSENKTKLVKTVSDFEELHNNINNLLNTITLNDEQKHLYLHDHLN